MFAIEAKNVSKRYRGSTLYALQELNLEIPSNQIYTLLGRNGAGKTTFIRICATQLTPSSGTVEIFGYDVIKDANVVRKFISVVPQEGKPLRALTPWDHVYNWLQIRGENKIHAKIKTTEILEKLDLIDVKDKPAMYLSGGMKQKILVAMAMATDSQLLFLDEPTIGLDPLSRRQVWSTIQDRKKEGKTILLTTHYMDEAEVLSDRIIIVNNGQIITQGTLQDLRKLIPQNIRMEIPKNSIDLEQLHSYGTTVEIGKDTLRIYTYESSIKELSELALKNNISFNISPITLDDIFVSLVSSKN